MARREIVAVPRIVDADRSHRSRHATAGWEVKTRTAVAIPPLVLPERGRLGMGQGQGRGDRPEEKTDNNFYDSKVKANIRKGKLVVTGNVAGPNKPGEALEAIKEAMAAASTSDENPLTNVRLPKAQLEQAQQYFDSVRDAK